MITGTLYVIDAFGCGAAPLNDIEFIDRLLTVFAETVRANVMRRLTYAFAPHGLTATAVLAESHLTIHTWPERDLLTLDLFACSPDIDIDAGLSVLGEMLTPTAVNVLAIERGAGMLRGRAWETR